MSLEKLGLLFLLSNKRDIAAAKSHFISSVRELVLGLSRSLEVVSKAADETGLPEKSPLVDAAIQRLDFLLQMTLKFLPKSPETEPEIWRQEILASIIGVLDAELMRLKNNTSNEETKLQKQALQTVKGVLKRHFINSEGAKNDASLKTDETIPSQRSEQQAV